MAENEVKQQPKQDAKQEKNKVVEVKAADNKKKKSKDKPKKQNKLVKSLKDTGNELKKVNWPKFGEVAKQTGIVLAFVAIFAVVVFGFDRLLSWLTSLL